MYSYCVYLKEKNEEEYSYFGIGEIKMLNICHNEDMISAFYG